MLLYLDLAYEQWIKNGKMSTATDLRDAIYHGAVKRVRPKAMTATVIIAGLLPIVRSHGAGADVMKRIATPMIGGVVTSLHSWNCSSIPRFITSALAGTLESSPSSNMTTTRVASPGKSPISRWKSASERISRPTAVASAYSPETLGLRFLLLARNRAALHLLATDSAIFSLLLLKIPSFFICFSCHFENYRPVRTSSTAPMALSFARLCIRLRSFVHPNAAARPYYHRIHCSFRPVVGRLRAAAMENRHPTSNAHKKISVCWEAERPSTSHR